MNTLLLSSGLGAIALSTLAMLGPPTESAQDQSTPTTLHLTVTRMDENAQPPDGHWEANLPPIGTLEITVNGPSRRVVLNKQVLPPDRVMWQPDNIVMVIDPSRQRQFQVALGDGGRIDFIRPGSWLEYRGDGSPRVAIGIYADPLSPALAAQLGLDPNGALVVNSVVQDMPAYKSGVRPFDVITAIDDQSHVTREVLKQVVASKEPGQTIQLHLVRRAQPVELSIDVEEVQPLSQADLDPLLTGPFKDLMIDPDTFSSPDDTWQFIQGGKGIIQFKGEQAIVFGNELPEGTHSIGRPGQMFNMTTKTWSAGDPHDELSQLRVQVEALSARLASIDAKLSRLLGEAPEADDAKP